jgi:hypothetical protein
VRLPPALAARATPEILALLGDPPARVLEVGFGGIHAVPLRLAGFEVVVVEPHARHREQARQRAGEALVAPPAGPGPFDAVVAPDGTDLTGIETRRVVLVRQDGSVFAVVV